MRAMYKRIADSSAAATRAEESTRVAGTRPSLALARYAGTYADSLFGTAAVQLRNGVLTLQSGTATGRLEHWQNDSFRVVWSDPFWDASYVSFVIDPNGTVAELRLLDGGSYRRVKS
jgi:hypothetical protein